MDILLNSQDWRNVNNLAEWLAQHNGSDPHQRSVQLLKIAEELGEYERATTRQEQIDELFDVALTALVAFAGEWALDPARTYLQACRRPLLDSNGHQLGLASAYGLVAEAYIGYIAQNPRKGQTHTREEVAHALCDITRVALRKAATYVALESGDPEGEFSAHLDRVAKRVGLSHLTAWEA